MKTQIIILFILWVLCFWGCGSESVVPIDSDTIVDSGTGTDTDTGTETDTGTGAIQVQPELPSLCSSTVYAQYLSGTGDGRTPSISTVSPTDSIMAWAYDSQETNSNSWVELASYDSATQVYTARNPFTDSVVSTNTKMTNNGTSHALVWSEGRSAWDVGCTPENATHCKYDVALATVTNGVVNEAVPIRVSQTGQVVGKPVVTAVSNGWVVAWGNLAMGRVAVLAAHVSTAGVVGLPVNISGEDFADDFPQISMAVLNDTILIAWRDNGQGSIHYRMLNGVAQSLTDFLVLDDGDFVYRPSVAAGPALFMVSYSLGTTDDSEIFTRLIQPDGQLVGQRTQITWTPNRRTMSSALVYVHGLGYGVTWLSEVVSGSNTCVDSVCSDKVFASVLNNDGTLRAEPILMSEGAGDLNPTKNVTIGTNGTEWVVAYELRKNLRQQLVYSTFSCQE